MPDRKQNLRNKNHTEKKLIMVFKTNNFKIIYSEIFSQRHIFSYRSTKCDRCNIRLHFERFWLVGFKCGFFIFLQVGILGNIFNIDEPPDSLQTASFETIKFLAFSFLFQFVNYFSIRVFNILTSKKISVG